MSKPIDVPPDEVQWDSVFPRGALPIDRSRKDFPMNAYASMSAPAINCIPSPCSPDCKSECCTTNRHGVRGSFWRARNKPKQHTDATTRLLPTVERTGDERCSSASSYGSNDSTDVLIRRTSPDLVVQSPTGSPPLTVMLERHPSIDPSVRCPCHVKPEDKTSKKARNKLIVASLIALVFMIGEIVGGYLANSLAILTDAAHMLSDFASFLISLFAIWVATRPPSKKFSFGWHRAEVMGAVISVLIIWVVTGVLVYEAIQRCIHVQPVNADVMLITACGGVYVNVFMMMVLGHGHSHGGGGGHGHSHGGHGHGHGRGGHSINSTKDHEEEMNEDDTQCCPPNDSERPGETEKPTIFSRWRRGNKKKHENKNINVRAAFIHVIGDLIQSIGVVIAGYVIRFTDWYLADPICTFMFSILVLISTLNVLKDAIRVLMEGTPKHINYEEVKAELQQLPGVKHAHSLHIWSLTLNRTAAAAHLALEPGADNQEVLDKASRMLQQKYGINQTTLQVENWQEEMNDCGTCQDTSKQKRFSFCWP